NRRFRDVSDAELFEFSQDSAESPTILPGQPNHDFADLLKRDGSAHLLIRLFRFFILNPTLPSAWVYNGDQPRDPGTDSESKFKQPFSLIVREEDFLLWDPRPKHFIFGLEKLNMSAQFVLSTPGQQKQQWRKPTGHRNIDSLEMAI
ncbi:MAG: hypothetical protein NXI22_21930, partial [bacterium]|nr:hypothetical protein [bacterium]